ncbi:uncharacterized protein SAMN05216359_102361 [Roseateles sp. YR242]|uniref:PP0621 family protein n=1 Tax=Roseateles sp. YR242 TaxID=1855305 RepID=UPI0008AEAA5C|nr:PP0621 family protein [Roseateles sp. YR242]SEK60474.1 uncharacterized protein SAMN05216359_102361 [Roseateles sp. YR242]
MKLLFWVLVLALFFFVLGFKRGRPDRPSASPASPARPAGPPPATPVEPEPEAMVRCTACGMHFPASDALPGRGGQFCSAEHRASFEARLG